MSRLSKPLAATMVVVFLLACNAFTPPLRNDESQPETAIPIETLDAFATALPDIGNVLNPQGAPAQEWSEIPIMPQATAGQEFPQNNSYSFRVNATMQEIQDFYNQKLTALGWNQPFDVPVEGDAGLMVFQKGSSILTITITASEDSSVVILSMTS